MKVQSIFITPEREATSRIQSAISALKKKQLKTKVNVLSKVNARISKFKLTN